MTSTAEPLRPARYPSWGRTILLVGLLSLLALQMPSPWGGLWILVPAAVAVSLLVGWRFGAWGVVVPVALFVGALAVAGADALWVWWIPVSGLTGLWMGLREEGEGPRSGARAAMMLPVMLLAVGLPWMLQYPDLLRNVERELATGDRRFLDILHGLGSSGERFAAMQRAMEDNAELRRRALPHLVPTFVFVWMAVLVAAGRTIASRLAGTMRWPALARASLSGWRLPDGALWLFLAGLAGVVLEWHGALPAAWTLLLTAGLGFCIQGIAVVESLLLARGVPPSIIVLTLVFVFTLALPVFLLSTVSVGLSDVWLDYRRLEAQPESDRT